MRKRQSNRLCFHIPGPWPIVLLASIMLATAVAGCGAAESVARATQPAPTVTAPAVSAEATGGEPSADGAAAPEDAAAADVDMSVEGVATAVSARTPIPTSTPGPIDREIEEFTAETGLTAAIFLGLPVEGWINTLVSGLILLVGIFAIKLLMVLIRRISKRFSSAPDDRLLTLITKYVGQLLGVVLIHFVLFRLDYLRDTLRTGLQDIYLIALLGVTTVFALDLINFLAQRYEEGLASAGDQRKLTPIIITVQRLAQTAVLIIAVSFLLHHLGFNISIVAAILIVSGFLFSFGAQDLLKDIVGGFIILVDQPFRVGDTVRVKELDTWGTVLDIGPRSTRIKTGDNREVIEPNSRIGRSQVVNYTYPDPPFRAQTEIGVAYNTDPEEMRAVIEQAVRSVEGVLPDRPVDALFVAFGRSTRTIRVRWWLESRRQKIRSLDKVNTALEGALGKAGIDLPFDTYDLNIRMADSAGEGLNQGAQHDQGPG